MNLQRLRKFENKGCTSNDRETETSLIKYSDYKEKQIAFKQIELHM